MSEENWQTFGFPDNLVLASPLMVYTGIIKAIYERIDLLERLGYSDIYSSAAIRERLPLPDRLQPGGYEKNGNRNYYGFSNITNAIYSTLTDLKLFPYTFGESYGWMNVEVFDDHSILGGISPFQGYYSINKKHSVTWAGEVYRFLNSAVCFFRSGPRGIMTDYSYSTGSGESLQEAVDNFNKTADDPRIRNYDYVYTYENHLRVWRPRQDRYSVSLSKSRVDSVIPCYGDVEEVPADIRYRALAALRAAAPYAINAGYDDYERIFDATDTGLKQWFNVRPCPLELPETPDWNQADFSKYPDESSVEFAIGFAADVYGIFDLTENFKFRAQEG